MQRFTKGQKVVCTYRTPSKIITKIGHDGKARTAPVPQFNEIVTVDEYSHIHTGCITFFEYPYIPPGDDFPCCFDQRHFEPLCDISELTEILNAQPAEI